MASAQHSTLPGVGAKGPHAFTPRCVLWHTAQTELPGELLTSLTKHIGRVTVCTDGFAALAEACLTERDRRQAGSSATGSSGSGGVLLLVQPQSLADAAAILGAAAEFAPSLGQWMYDRTSNPKLRAIVEDDVRGWAGTLQKNGNELGSVLSGYKPAKQRESVPTPSSFDTKSVPRERPAPPSEAPHKPMVAINGPGLMGSIEEVAVGTATASPKLRLAGSFEQDGLNRESAKPARPAPLLTEAELRMLLSDEPLNAPPFPSRGTKGEGER